MSLAKRRVEGGIADVGHPTASEFRTRVARRNANRHLRAYVFDRNPQHIFDAWDEVRRAGIAPSEIMLKNLDHALREIRKRPRRRPRSNTVRDIELYRQVESLKRALGPGNDRLASQMVADAAGLKLSHVRKIHSDVGKALADPTSDRAPRAFK